MNTPQQDDAIARTTGAGYRVAELSRRATGHVLVEVTHDDIPGWTMEFVLCPDGESYVNEETQR